MLHNPLPCYIFYIHSKKCLCVFSINFHFINAKYNIDVVPNGLKKYSDCFRKDYLFIYNKNAKDIEIYDIISLDVVLRSSKFDYTFVDFYFSKQMEHALIMIKNDVDSLDTDTIYSYIEALKKIFVIEEVIAWNPNLRSQTAIRSSNTRYFVDPSIATASLGIGPKDLLNDLRTFGFIFEALCIRDLRVYAESLDGNVYHYRDANGLECDAVIHLRNGSYGLIEIKLGGDKLINEGIDNLKNMYKKIDIDKMKNPSFMMVLTATGNYAYRREDGIYIVPIGCLKD